MFYQNKMLKISDFRIENIEENLREVINGMADSKEKEQLDFILNEIVRLRFIPAEEILIRFPRDVRNMAKEQNKKISFSYSGSGTEIPSTMESEITQILTHLIRESIFGIQTEGEITVHVEDKNQELKIEVKAKGHVMDEEHFKRNGYYKEAEITGYIGENPEDKVGYKIVYDWRQFGNGGNQLAGRTYGIENILNDIKRYNGRLLINSNREKGTEYDIILPLPER